MSTTCSNCGAALEAGARFCPSCGARVLHADEEGGLIGKTFNEKYHVVSELGTGAMGTVFLGEHLGLKKKIALKVLHPDLGFSQETLQRFQREGIAAGKFSHPNAIQIFDFDRSEDGHTYLAMEYVEGDNLRTFLAAEGPLAPDVAVELTRQVLAALSEAHRHGIVHRDLKPENIMVLRGSGGELRVKVLDFGLSKLVDRPLAASMRTQVGRVMGTPLYMSPEQANGETVDHRSDLYAVGLILFEMLAGTGPFQGGSFTELLLQQASGPAPSLLDAQPELGVSGELDAVLAKALERERDQRFQSASEMMQSLAGIRLEASGAVRRRAPATVPPPATPPHRTEVMPPQRTLDVKLVAGVVVVGVLVVAVAAAAFSGFLGGAAVERPDTSRVREVPESVRTSEEQEYIGFLDRALSHMRGGDSGSALSSVQQAYGLACRDAEVYLVRAQVYRQRDEPDTAMADLRTALQEDPSCAEAAAAMGWIHFERGDLTEAAASFGQARDIDPESAAALAGEGALLASRGDTAAGKDLLRQAIALDGDCAPAHLQLGLVLLDEGDVDGAIDELVEAKLDDPGSWEALTALGDAYLAAARPDEAEKQYRAALGVAPDAEDALLGLGSMLVEGERYALAIDALAKPLERRPDRGSLQVIFAAALQGEDRDMDAIEALQRAVGAGADGADVRTLLGALLLKADQAFLALGQLDGALAESDTLASAHLNRGLALFQLERHEEAVTALERCLELDEETAFAHFALGILYMDYVPRRDEATARFERFRELGGDDERLDGWLEGLRRP